MTIIEVTCGWCNNQFDTPNDRISKVEAYLPRHCPHCGRTVQASRKEFTGNVIGKKRFKLPSRVGDIV